MMKFSHLLSITRIVTLAVAIFFTGIASGADIVETLDATRVEGKIKSITSKEIILTVDAGVKTFPIQEVASVTLASPVTDAMLITGQVIVTTVSGHILVTSPRSLATKGENLLMTNSLLGKVQVDFASLIDIIMPTSDMTPKAVITRCTRLDLQAVDDDMLIIERDDGNWIGVEGSFKGLTTNKKVQFIVDDIVRQKDISACPAVRFMGLSKPTTTVGTLVGIKGTQVRFTSLTINGDKVTVEAPLLGKLTLDRDDIAMIKLQSDQVINLADIEPSSVKEYGVFDQAFRYRKNLSISGKPLKLNGKTYPTGLGMHSFCELTYNLEGKYAKFVSVIGIDETVKPLGDADVVFLCDGKEVKTVRVLGTADASNIVIVIKGVKKFTIRVTFGSDGLGVSDHVNLAGARLLK